MSRLRALLTLGPVALLAAAAAYEAARTFKAQELLKPDQIKGPHHQVADAVPTEGYFHLFKVKTDWGEAGAEGLSLLRVRLEEVNALAQLDDVSKSEVFLKSAGGAVLNVGKGIGALVTDPGGTAKNLGGGLKRFGTNLGRKAKRTSDQVADDAKGDDKQQEASDKSGAEKTADAAGGVANSVLGVNGAARKWAQKVGADPYTTNPVLKKALTDLGKIDAAGSIATKVVLPIPPVVSTTASVSNMVWAKDPEALLKENEAEFKSLGVTDATIKKLYLSKGFTLTLHTRLAQALSAVKAVGSAEYVATAAESDTEREALFFCESAEWLRRFHETTPVEALLPESRAAIAKTKDGRAVALVPVDWIQWTAPVAKAVTEAAARTKKQFGVTSIELRITGRASDVAKKEVATAGWKLTENGR